MDYRPYSYYLGLDLGQAQDYSALAIVEEPVYVGTAWANDILYQGDELEPGWISPSLIPTPYQLGKALKAQEYYGRPANPTLLIRHLERFPLGTRYDEIVKRVADIIRSPMGHMPCILLIDKTGVGAAVLDNFTSAGIGATAITLHGGGNVSRDPQRPGFRVPKRDLASTVQVLLQNGRLKVAPELPEAKVLKKELTNFRVKIDPKTAHDSYEHWRESDHDDLVLAVAMAVWFRQYYHARVDRQLAARLGRTNLLMGGDAA